MKYTYLAWYHLYFKNTFILNKTRECQRYSKAHEKCQKLLTFSTLQDKSLSGSVLPAYFMLSLGMRFQTYYIISKFSSPSFTTTTALI